MVSVKPKQWLWSSLVGRQSQEVWGRLVVQTK